MAKTAVILAGGKGTRLAPYTVTIPKPLLPIGDYPILEIVMRQLVDAGIERIVLTLGHMAPFFTAFLGDGVKYGVKLEYCIEEEPLGTAAPLRLIDGWDHDFLVMNGDILTTLDFRAMIAHHQQLGAMGTIAVARRVQNIDYGVIEMDDKSLMANYIEKPSLPYLVSMGINVLSPRARLYIPESGRFDMPQLMLAMRDGGETVGCFASDCYWKDMGRFDDFQEASEDFAQAPGRFLPGGA